MPRDYGTQPDLHTITLLFTTDKPHINPLSMPKEGIMPKIMEVSYYRVQGSAPPCRTRGVTG